MHRLDWDWGDYEFCEAMTDISRKLRGDTVYIKGNEKYKFMRQQLPNAKLVELENLPSFRTLNNCLHERCEVKHGNHCARRKVYGSLYFVNYKQESYSRNTTSSIQIDFWRNLLKPKFQSIVNIQSELVKNLKLKLTNRRQHKREAKII